MIGIFIGLQVDEWNRERKERQEEVRLLNALQAEVLDGIKSRTTILDFESSYRAQLIDAIEVIQNVDQSDTLSPNQCSAVWQSHIVNGFVASRLLALDEITSSGKLGILRSRELRSALIAFESDLDDHQHRTNFINADIANVVDNYADLLPRRWIPEQRRSVVECNLSGIRQNQSIRNSLLSNLARRSGVASYIADEIHSLEKIQTLITAGK